jgi:exoribonuclease R
MQLEHYNDLIEHRLNKQLAGKSTMFFTAVETCDALSKQLSDTRQAVVRLR